MRKFLLQKINLKFLGWLIPVSISVYALTQSYQANELAEKALVIGQRPYITAHPIKFKEVDSFIFARELNGGLEIKFLFE